MAGEMEKTTNFDSFWKAYPNRKGKGAARTAYDKQEKIHGDPIDFIKTVLSAIAVQGRYRKQQQGMGVFVPQWKNPVTWLNQECWTDEVAIEPRDKKPTIGAQCSKCTNPVHGPRFTLCEVHEAWQPGKSLVGEMITMYNKLSETCKTTDEWRAKYRELARGGIGGNYEKA